MTVNDSRVKNTSTSYEPYYLSNEFGWKNRINFHIDEQEHRSANIQFANHMVDQLIRLLDSKDVDTMTIRQAFVSRIEDGTLNDPELHDFDKKVVLDCRAKRRETPGS